MSYIQAWQDALCYKSMELMRLNKYLVDAGVCSRRGADRLIQLGEITINDVTAELGQKVDGTEEILVQGKLVTGRKEKYVYLAYNKPVGIICTSDLKAKDNIIAAVNYPERVFTIGRLDVGSCGLILLTNNGEVANKMLRTGDHHEKEYRVTIDVPITPEFLKGMKEGVMVLGRKTLPAKVEQVDDYTFFITLVEGRNRQIRRMCETFNTSVRILKRIRVMNIEIGDLRVGEWRHLTSVEEKELLSAL